MFRIALAVFALAAGLFGGCSTNAPSPGPGSFASVRQAAQGTPTSDHHYAVGVCTKASGPGACGEYCSGTLIAPNLVLTARHCVDVSTNTQGMLECGVDSFTTRATTPAQTFVTTGADMNAGTAGWHAVSEIHTPTMSEACRSDIALLVLDANVASTEAKPADVLAFGPMTDHGRYATEIGLIGFGLSDPTVQSTLGQRRILEHTLITCIPGDPVFQDTFCKAGGTTIGPDGGSSDSLDDLANFGASYGGCPGDSGGGAYEQTALSLGVALVMGVQSRAATEGHVCVGLAFTRTDAWKDFLVATATNAAQSGGYALPAWAKGPTTLPFDAGAPPADASGSPDAPFALGSSCVRSSECGEGACVAVNDAPATCVARCGVARSCASESAICTPVDGEEVCLPAITTTANGTTSHQEDSGCAIALRRPHPRGPSDLAWGAFALIGLAAWTRRSRRHGARS